MPDGSIWVLERRPKKDDEWMFVYANPDWETVKLANDPIFRSPRNDYRVVEYRRNS